MESVSTLVNGCRQEDALTANGAVTNSTSLNSVLDLFFIAGASRTMSEKDIQKMLTKAWVEDKLLTAKVIFWAGDIRGGAGERRFFRIAIKWLSEQSDDVFTKNFKLVPEYTRWDNLFAFKDNGLVMNFIFQALKDKNGLLAKWLPRKKQYDNFAAAFRSHFELSPEAYRKTIVALSKTIEQQMSKKNWTAIKYDSVPSVAFKKYRKAFFRNDETRFKSFLEAVEKGEKTIKAGAIFPHDIIKAYIGQYDHSAETKRAIEAQWKCLPDYLADSDERMLPICDVSGSMSGMPILISVALGLYLSERNRSIFKDAFVTFSEHPTMEYLKGTVCQRIDQLQKAAWDMNTDLNAVFDLLLSKAVSNNLSAADMPTTLLIISDMEFDNCGHLTNYKNIVEKYEAAGYVVPKIVFWNVNGREGNVPVACKTPNVGLVSGASPSIVRSVLSGETITPVSIMLRTLNTERYAAVSL
jgi:hypothetical protein